MSAYADRPVRHAVVGPEAARQPGPGVPPRSAAAHPRRAHQRARRDQRPVHRRRPSARRATPAGRCCSRPTSWARPSTSAIGSCSSTRAGSSTPGRSPTCWCDPAASNLTDAFLALRRRRRPPPDADAAFDRPDHPAEGAARDAARSANAAAHRRAAGAALPAGDPRPSRGSRSRARTPSRPAGRRWRCGARSRRRSSGSWPAPTASRSSRGAACRTTCATGLTGGRLSRVEPTGNGAAPGRAGRRRHPSGAQEIEDENPVLAAARDAVASRARRGGRRRLGRRRRGLVDARRRGERHRLLRLGAARVGGRPGPGHAAPCPRRAAPRSRRTAAHARPARRLRRRRSR